MNKKGFSKYWVWIFAVGALIILILLFGLKPADVFHTAFDTSTKTASLIQNTSTLYTYSFVATPYYTQNGNAYCAGGLPNPAPMDQGITWSSNAGQPLNLPSDIQYGVAFPAVVTISGATGELGPTPTLYCSQTSVNVQNVTATCTAQNSNYVTCEAIGTVYPQDQSTVGQRGLALLDASFAFQVDFIKQGQSQGTQGAVSNSPAPTQSSSSSSLSGSTNEAVSQQPSILTKILNWFKNLFGIK